MKSIKNAWEVQWPSVVFLIGFLLLVGCFVLESLFWRHSGNQYIYTKLVLHIIAMSLMLAGSMCVQLPDGPFVFVFIACFVNICFLNDELERQRLATSLLMNLFFVGLFSITGLVSATIIKLRKPSYKNNRTNQGLYDSYSSGHSSTVDSSKADSNKKENYRYGNIEIPKGGSATIYSGLSKVAEIDAEGNVRDKNYWRAGRIDKDGNIQDKDGWRIGRIDKNSEVRDRNGRRVGNIDSWGNFHDDVGWRKGKNNLADLFSSDEEQK